MWHRLMHLLGWNYGRVVTRLYGDAIWVGFQCDKCRKITGWHRTGF